MQLKRQIEKFFSAVSPIQTLILPFGKQIQTQIKDSQKATKVWKYGLKCVIKTKNGLMAYLLILGVNLAIIH